MILVGNWKMNGMSSELDIIRSIDEAAADVEDLEICLCLPATLIRAAKDGTSNILIGAQDCHERASGPYTGGVSAHMLTDAGASVVILGHSECRSAGDDDDRVRAKIIAAAAAHLRPLLCVGEDRAAFEAGLSTQVITQQLKRSLPTPIPPGTMIAYEPIWAIGTGEIPSSEHVASATAAIRKFLAQKKGEGRRSFTPIIYGGSVQATNTVKLLSEGDVSGLLVGTASLTLQAFLPIVRAMQMRLDQSVNRAAANRL